MTINSPFSPPFIQHYENFHYKQRTIKLNSPNNSSSQVSHFFRQELADACHSRDLGILSSVAQCGSGLNALAGPHSCSGYSEQQMAKPTIK